MKVSIAKAWYVLDEAGFRFSLSTKANEPDSYAYDKEDYRITFKKNKSRKAVSAIVFKLLRDCVDGCQVIDDKFQPVVGLNLLQAIKYVNVAEGK